MPTNKEITNFYSSKESIVDILLEILSSNNAYVSYMQAVTETIANQEEDFYNEQK